MTAATISETDEPASEHPDGFDVGAVVIDQEDPDPNPAVVVNCPPVSCADWGAYYDKETGEEVTVADDNPSYDPEAEVVVVAFRNELIPAHPDYEADEPLPLAEAECRTYSFPPARLRPTGETFDGAEPVVVLDEDMVALRDRLRDAGADVAVDSDAGEPVLLVEKLGVEHRVTADGEVSGGPLADRLQDVAAEYLGGDGR